MTLPGSGPISIAQMRDEYQMGNPISMNQFFGKPGIQGSGPISFSNFHGKSFFTVTGGNGLVTGSAGRAGCGTTTVTTGTSGDVTITGGVPGYGYEWQHISGVSAQIVNAGSSTVFRRTANNGCDSNTVVGTYRLKVTDSAGNVAYGPNVSVETTHYNSQ